MNLNQWTYETYSRLRVMDEISFQGKGISTAGIITGLVAEMRGYGWGIDAIVTGAIAYGACKVMDRYVRNAFATLERNTLANLHTPPSTLEEELDRAT